MAESALFHLKERISCFPATLIALSCSVAMAVTMYVRVSIKCRRLGSSPLVRLVGEAV